MKTYDQERLHHIEYHFHGVERWVGAKAGWTGGDGDNEGDETVLTEYQIDAGNDTWSAAEYCVLGTLDTPFIAVNTKFDFHRLLITATEANVIYKVRIAWGTGYAAAVGLGDFTEVCYIPSANKVLGCPVDIMMPRIDVGTKIFMSCWADGTDTATIDFLIGLHEYNG